jgi:hypothetical protein
MAHVDGIGVPYVTANDAVSYIAGHVGSRYQARLLIADALHCGDIITTADKIWSVSDIDPTDDWGELISGAELLYENVELPADYWMASSRWPEETRHWRWKEGNFLLNISDADVDPFIGEALENVQFDHRQVMALVGKTERSGAGGRKPDVERWAMFWTNFLYDCTNDFFDWTKFENKRQLKLAMLASSPSLFADSAVDKAVDVAWNGLVLRYSRERLDMIHARVSEE